MCVTVEVNNYEHQLMVTGLMEYRNALMEQGRPVDDVNDLIYRVVFASPPKRARKRSREER